MTVQVAVEGVVGASALRDAVAQLRADRAAFATWSSDQRHAALASVDHVIACLTAVRGDLLLAERDASTWKRNGDPSFEAWRGRTSGTGMREAGAEVRRAETLGDIPAMRAAVEAGELTLAHVDVVARTAAGASEPVRQALATPAGQAAVLDLARRTDAGRFAKAAAAWSASVDQASLQRSHDAHRAARFLNLTDTPGGTRLAGLLDPVAGHRLRLALETVTGKSTADDDRSPEQRRADALEAMAAVTLATPAGADVPSGRRPQVSLVLRPETWSALRDAARSPRTPSDDGGARGPKAGAPVPIGAPATLEDGSPVPASELARTLCDCELTRVVLGADADVLDLGRAVRMYTPGQRRAITARDLGCLWPGCGTAPRWCEVHHLVWWDRDGGTTAVLDGALACSFHHHEIHRLDLVVTRVTVPEGTGADARTAAYVITTPGGRLVADGRGRSASGARAGLAVRTWTPGSGPSAGAPDVVLTALARGSGDVPSALARGSDDEPSALTHGSDDRPPDARSPGMPIVSVPAGTLLPWTS